MELMAQIPSIFKKQTPKDAFLVLDIGTKIIKAVIFFVEDDKIIVSGYGKELQKLENYTKDVKRLADFCKVAIFRAQKEARLRKVRGVILGFGGGFVKGETFSQKFFREEPQKFIDTAELKNILQRFQWKAKEEICRQPEESVSCPPKILQSWICEARIDGYQVANPFDFQGKEVMLSVFNSYCTSDFLNFLEEFVNFLKLDLLGVFDEEFAVYQVLSRISTPNFSAILIDVGGVTTQISLVRKGVFEKSVGFSIGSKNFTELLIKSFGVSELEAEDIKIRYSKGGLGYGVAKRIAKIFEPTVALWYEALNLALEEFPFRNYLPGQIYLFGGGSLLPEIKNGLVKKRAKENLAVLSDFKAEILSPEFFKNFVEGLEEYGLPQDTIPLGVAASFSWTLEKENVFEKILKQTLKIIQ